MTDAKTDRIGPRSTVRPEILFPLFTPVTNLTGIGPRLAKLFEKLAGPNVVDLCLHLPSGLIDRRYAPSLAVAQAGRIATLTLRVGAHQSPHTKRQPYRVVCHDDTGSIELVFFHAHPDYLTKILPEGAERLVSGRVEVFAGGLQMTHPDHIGTLAERDEVMKVEAVYPLTTGLTQKTVGKAVAHALEKAPDLPEWLDPAYRKKHGWQDWHAALRQAHAPGEVEDLSPLTAARSRLAFDELLANQLALALVRRHLAKRRGRSITGDGRLRRVTVEALPFKLTSAQDHAVAEILAEMAADTRMLRLLQGDVGSGKTMVALLVMLAAVEAGCQAAIMAPTDILARQHFKTMRPLAEKAGVGIELLTGRDKGKARQAIVGRLASGESALAVGTHALFQQDVEFHDLALAVVDEQHRFGVHQRLDLTSKGHAVDVLVMTATPIPRTLMLTAYGDMETSRLMEKPAGRQAIDTRVLPLERLGEVTDAAARAMAAGAKIFWICPLVEESEAIDLAAADQRHADLQARFGERVGLVHGRMKAAEKDAAMTAFAEGSIDLLVATTVIEVGVDVPAASVMVVEHAERFGLAQLHQLRGRIGRGSTRSSCLLLYQSPLGETARARLRILRETDDGFRIAEEDLRLRGAGELLGTRQSGFPEFRVADLAVHANLLAAARDDASLVINRDPDLQSDRGTALRVLLYLFERDAAVRFLSSG